MLTILAGLTLVLVGILVLFWPPRDKKDHYVAISGEKKDHTRIRSVGGAVVMLGPLPIVIGSDPKIAFVMMVMALAMMVLWMLTTQSV